METKRQKSKAKNIAIIAKFDKEHFLLTENNIRDWLKYCTVFIETV